MSAPFGCCYCLQTHTTEAELQACGAAFWERVDQNAARERGIEEYAQTARGEAAPDDVQDYAEDTEFAKEAKREAFQ